MGPRSICKQVDACQPKYCMAMATLCGCGGAVLIHCAQQAVRASPCTSDVPSSQTAAAQRSSASIAQLKRAHAERHLERTGAARCGSYRLDRRLACQLPLPWPCRRLCGPSKKFSGKQQSSRKPGDTLCSASWWRPLCHTCGTRTCPAHSSTCVQTMQMSCAQERCADNDNLGIASTLSMCTKCAVLVARNSVIAVR